MSAATLAAWAACFSLRAAFRVCHDLLSVFGFGFSLLFLRASRLSDVVLVAMILSSALSARLVRRALCHGSERASGEEARAYHVHRERGPAVASESGPRLRDRARALDAESPVAGS